MHRNKEKKSYYLNKYYKRARKQMRTAELYKQSDDSLRCTSEINVNNDDNLNNTPDLTFSENSVVSAATSELCNNNFSSREQFASSSLHLKSDNTISSNNGFTSVFSDNISSELRKWALEHKLPHTALSDLLKILKPHFTNLPVDARTLLHTCRDVKTISVHPGQYCHFGIRQCIENLLFKQPSLIKNLQTIKLCINIDGLPLSKSSSSQFYPILCRIFEGRSEVDMIGLYHGNEKPQDVNIFLNEFVTDVVDLVNNGIETNGKTFSVVVKAFICDVPAKSFITCTKGHTGYASCTKCQEEGSYINNRVCFPNTDNLQLRTDQSFRLKIQEDHHTGTSILEKIPGFNMIENFPLDYMHLLCLGVVKKLLVTLWCCGKPGNKLPHQEVNNISELLCNISKDIPVEFSRKPRSLTEVKRWKATEFRQFLFYTGPVVLKDILDADRYRNFLSLHIACTILSSLENINNGYLEHAETLLKYFANTFQMLYGSEHVSHNIHNLLHITADVLQFGPLDNFSAFPFENYLQSILKVIPLYIKVIVVSPYG